MTNPDRDELVKLAGNERALFDAADRAYFKAGATSNPQDWFHAGLLARQHRNALTALRRLASSDGAEPVRWEWCCFEDNEQRTGWQCEGHGDQKGWEKLAESNPAKYRIVRRPLYTAPPADAGMRPTTEDILERINTELSTMAESWVGAFSGLSDGDDVAEYLTG
ncbi:MAG: hypothetical protein J0I08_23445, partial [Rhizobiales bacterium]|nr:hypothetical protein [Hyphomicrobiales bacterium]